MYYITLTIIILCSIFEMTTKNKRRKKILFLLSFFIISVQLCLRFGQGTDYYGYMYNYYYEDVHSEIGYKFLCSIFLKCGVRFEYFVLFISLFQLMCIYRGIMLYSPYKCMSLLIMYPTIYLTYFFSAIRQGMLIAFFIGFMLKWLIERKWLKYIISCLIFATIHSASLILLLLLVIYLVNIKILYIGIWSAVICGGIICIIPSEYFSFVEIGALQYYIHNISIGYFGLLERIVLWIIITLLRYDAVVRTEIERKKMIDVLYKIYLVGFLISIVLFPWNLVSSRLGSMMKAIELVLIPILVKEGKVWRQLLIMFLACYSLVMTAKNISSYIEQSGYENINVLTYPYYSIFNKEEAINARVKVLSKEYIEMLEEKYLLQ